MTDNQIDAMPTKAFFVNMLVRDISLERAVLDLLDNCIDGAQRLKGGEDANYTGLKATITMDSDAFVLEDNCGGFTVEMARNYAFRFGRPDDAESTSYSIGQFGVGMKRALFKFGTYFKVESTTEDEHWSMRVDVPRWLADPHWTFSFDEPVAPPPPGERTRGTRIAVCRLRPEVANQFDSSMFRRRLSDLIRSHERKFLAAGLEVHFGGHSLSPSELSVRAGGEFQPAVETFVFAEDTDTPISVRIVVGVADGSPTHAGWYVVCNRRVILAADRTAFTGWGAPGNSNDQLPKYSNAYARFRGIVFFSCSDSSKMPWNTTKTGLDDGALVWREAYERMRYHARSVLDFLNDLGRERSEYGDAPSPLDTALRKETTPRDVEEFAEDMRFAWNEDPPEVGPKRVRIQYSREAAMIEDLKETLGVRSAKAVGERSFDIVYDEHAESGP